MEIYFIEWKYILSNGNIFYRILLHFGNHSLQEPADSKKCNHSNLTDDGCNAYLVPFSVCQIFLDRKLLTTILFPFMTVT